MAWQSRTIDETPHGWRATFEDRVIISHLTEEQARRYQAGELDYCDGCMDLVAPFCGEHCSTCEAYCRQCYGACARCGETAITFLSGKAVCRKHAQREREEANG